jgi:hypothetical protein
MPRRYLPLQADGESEKVVTVRESLEKRLSDMKTQTKRDMDALLARNEELAAAKTASEARLQATITELEVSVQACSLTHVWRRPSNPARAIALGPQPWGLPSGACVSARYICGVWLVPQEKADKAGHEVDGCRRDKDAAVEAQRRLQQRSDDMEAELDRCRRSLGEAQTASHRIDALKASIAQLEVSEPSVAQGLPGAYVWTSVGMCVGWRCAY